MAARNLSTQLRFSKHNYSCASFDSTIGSFSNRTKSSTGMPLALTKREGNFRGEVVKHFLIAIVLILGLTEIVRANAGDLDPLFDLDGKVTTDFGACCAGASAMALQPDGKIIAAGVSTNNDFALARYNPNGSLDPTFGSGGIVITDLAAGSSDSAADMAIQSDGKIIVVGQSAVSDSDFAVVRYNPNGTLDPTFGIGGKVTTDIDGSDLARAVAIYSDGKIVVAGGATPFLDGIPNSVVVRYNPNGSLDPIFGTGGIVIANLSVTANDFFNDVLIQPDDKIIVAGVVTPAVNNQDFALARYNPNGTLDPTFGSGGIVTTDFTGEFDQAWAVLLHTGGKILAAGSVGPSQFSFDFGLVQYNPNGSLDPTFGTGGKVTTDFGGSDTVNDIIMQPNGKIVAVGSTTPIFDFALARYNPDGSLDPTFGTSGIVTTDFPGVDSAFSVAVQPDGMIVLAGTGGSNDFGLARYEGDTLIASCTLFSEDFEDGILASDWTYVKPLWSEAGGNLIGTPSSKKAEVIATPAFAGCGTGACSVQTTMQTAGGSFNKIWFFVWFQDKNNTIEVLMQEEKDKWILRQRAGGVIVAKVKAPRAILPDVVYDVKITFDGNTFTLFVDGFSLVSMNAGAVPSGTIGYRVKKTTGRFGSVCVN